MKLPEKLKDLGSLTIPCVIGEHTFSKALCYLGVSINLMLYSVAKRLNLGEIESTNISLKWQIDRWLHPKELLKMCS